MGELMLISQFESESMSCSRRSLCSDCPSLD